MPKRTSLNDITVVVLAGGKGTRIKDIHPDLPKPLVPVLGKPFLFWLTAQLAGLGLEDFVYSTGHMAEKIAAWSVDYSLPHLSRRTRAETEPLGTGGGVLNCLDLCRDWILVVNGDGFCIGGIPELIALAGQAGVDGGLIGVHVKDTARYGSLSIDAEGYLSAFREKVLGSGHINSGVYLFRAEMLRDLGPVRPMSMEHDLIPGLIEAGARLKVVGVGESPFIDIGTPETLRQAEAFVSSHLSYLI